MWFQLSMVRFALCWNHINSELITKQSVNDNDSLFSLQVSKMDGKHLQLLHGEKKKNFSQSP